VGASVWGGAGAPLPEPPHGRDANAIVEDLVRVRRIRLAVKAEKDDLSDRLIDLDKRDRGLGELERRGEQALKNLISCLTVPREDAPPPPDHS
jgi:hypothetical protein